MRFLSLVLCVGLATPVVALDYKDHVAVCETLEANRTHAWHVGEKEKFPMTCACEVAAFAKLLEPEKFEWAMAWRVDAEAFAKNLPEGINIIEFMTEMISLGQATTQMCPN